MPDSSETVIVDVKIKFVSMVVLLLKLAFAAIPATIVLAIFWAFLAASI